MKHRTIFLLLNAKSKIYNHSVKIWLKDSGFITKEMPDIFDAMEVISDFTVQCSPELVLVEACSPMMDFQIIQRMMPSSIKDKISIFSLTEHEKVINDKECFEGNFAEVTAKLSLTHSTQAKAKYAG